MIVGIVGMKGYGKTTYCKLAMKNYDIVLAIFGSVPIENFKKIDTKIYKLTDLNNDINNFYRAYEMIQKYKKDAKIMLLFDDADFYLSDRFDQELNKLFVFARNFNIDIYYNAKRLIGISSYVKYNTDVIVFFRYNRLFVKDLKDMKLPDDIINQIISLEKYQYLTLKL